MYFVCCWDIFIEKIIYCERAADDFTAQRVKESHGLTDWRCSASDNVLFLYFLPAAPHEAYMLVAAASPVVEVVTT